MEGTMTVANSVPTTAAAKQRRRRPLVVAPVCADCRFSEVYALQVRTHCAHPNATLHGSILFAGQPACRGLRRPRRQGLLAQHVPRRAHDAARVTRDRAPRAPALRGRGGGAAERGRAERGAGAVGERGRGWAPSAHPLTPGPSLRTGLPSWGQTRPAPAFSSVALRPPSEASMGRCPCAIDGVCDRPPDYGPEPPRRDGGTGAVRGPRSWGTRRTRPDRARRTGICCGRSRSTSSCALRAPASPSSSAGGSSPPSQPRTLRWSSSRRRPGPARPSPSCSGSRRTGARSRGSRWTTSDDDPVVLLRSLVSGLMAVAPVDPALLEPPAARRPTGGRAGRPRHRRGPRARGALHPRARRRAVPRRASLLAGRRRSDSGAAAGRADGARHAPRPAPPAGRDAGPGETRRGARRRPRLRSRRGGRALGRPRGARRRRDRRRRHSGRGPGGDRGVGRRPLSRDAGRTRDQGRTTPGVVARTAPRRPARDRRVPCDGGPRATARRRAGVPPPHEHPRARRHGRVPTADGARGCARRPGAPRRREPLRRPSLRSRWSVPLPPPLRRVPARRVGAPRPRGCDAPQPDGGGVVLRSGRRGPGGAPLARGRRRAARGRHRGEHLADDVEPRPAGDGAALARGLQRRADPGAPRPHTRGRLGAHGAERRPPRAALGPGGLQRPAGRRALVGRRRLAALVAGAPARHPRPGRRQAHARGRRAGGQARVRAGGQLVRRRAGHPRRRALALRQRAPRRGGARARGARGRRLERLGRAGGARHTVADRRRPRRLGGGARLRRPRRRVP